ncbi:MAG: hypothetical protein K0S51_920 [Bacillales bacterium]|jgi:hypothetical protein|nr:hypothetical protein [Bacillales bacterium]
MVNFWLDFILIAVIIVGITATMGVILNWFGVNIFGRKNSNEFTIQSDKSIAGFKKVGGKKLT